MWMEWSQWSKGCYMPKICVPRRNRTCLSRAPYTPSCIGSALEIKQCRPLPEVNNTNCKNPLGMENGRIKDSQITASSVLSVDPHADYFASHARLHLKSSGRIIGGWAPDAPYLNQFIQVDLGNRTVITKVATQGRAELTYNQFTSEYSLSYSDDATDWKDYEGDCVKIFPGNTDQNTVVTNEFEVPIIARYVRLIVKSWTSHAFIRMELYGCPYNPA
ncbi:lactadherin [Exaiptasia diaphana]|uniref:F5/8 type C domain-containing protein n=1 Tax=Exaiptasia diaphana TaxID=2652724 RepID=A0A913YWI3_EXADI|nr:lactadherin [Exaiptasia diaphana]